MKQSDLNHLRRLLGWVRCDIGQDPAGQQQTMIDIAGKLGIDSIDADAKARLVEGYRRAEAVPVYVRDAVKALEKALAAVGRDPGVVAPRATAETRANTGFDPGAGAGREPVLDDVQIERGLAEIGVYVWGQRGEDWLAGVEYLARLLRAGEACPAVAPLQNHPDATAWPVACRDTPAAPPTLRRDDTGGAGAGGRGAVPDRCKCSLAIRLTGDGCRYCQPQTYIDTLEMCAEDNLRTIEQLQGECAEQARLLGAGGERELALMARIDSLEAARLAYASEFPPNEDGDPDAGSIHQNIRVLKGKLAQVDHETAGQTGSCRSAINLQVMQEALRLMPSDEARRVAREAEAVSGTVTPSQYVGAGAIAILAKLRTPVADERGLLPCPFCGSEAFETFKTDDDGIRRHSVHCKALNCGGQTRDRHFSEAEAIAAWNRRAAVLAGRQQRAGDPLAAEAMAHLRTIANFGGTLEQAKELATRGVNRCAAMSAPEGETC